jgi:tripartite-type tricarboxylate transporter receptor subunit TctC
LKSSAHSTLFALALLLAAGPAAHAQAWPARPLHLVVPYGTGGAPDILARLLGQKLNVALGQSVIVDNKPGAGGNLGADAVAKSAPDGYTLLLTTTATQAINPGLYPVMPYDAQRDFTPVGMVAFTRLMLVTSNTLPAKTLNELIAHLKSQPGRVSYGSAGPGTMQHMAGALFDNLAATQSLHVPYKGSGQLMPDLVAGRVSMTFNSIAAVLPMVKDGKLRAIAVTGPRRIAAAPDVPTFAEAGLAGFDASAWYAVFGPAGLPRDIVQRVNSELARAVASAEMRERCAALGLEAESSTPEDLARAVREDTTKWAAVIRKNNIVLQ